MKKKIIITGGLGYIGTELCKLYSGVSWHHHIIVIDNRFISERVNQIRNWNMKFIQGDILDIDLIKECCKDADVVHHLAGITDVPRTISEASTAQDEKIKEVGEKGTQNILDSISDKCKIIFPSTHIVYEGIDEVKTDIKEGQIITWADVALSADIKNSIALKTRREMELSFRPRKSNLASPPAEAGKHKSENLK